MNALLCTEVSEIPWFLRRRRSLKLISKAFQIYQETHIFLLDHIELLKAPFMFPRSPTSESYIPSTLYFTYFPIDPCIAFFLALYSPISLYNPSYYIPLKGTPNFGSQKLEIFWARTNPELNEEVETIRLRGLGFRF